MLNDLFTLDGRIAIVTGAAGLLGRQHSLALAQYGARVVLADIDPEGCRALASELGAHAVACDVTSKASWKSLIDVTVREYGRIDVLVNNAAFTNQSQVAFLQCAFPRSSPRRLAAGARRKSHRSFSWLSNSGRQNG